MRILLQVLFFVFVLLPFTGKTASLKVSEISILTVNSAITPATYDYLKTQFETLPKDSVVVLKLNTPGGLVTTTKDIITLVGKEKRPFVVWITPEGASASSAGAIIASSAHYIFMSPGTNMGAATPVGLGDDIKESDGKKKILNDLTALVRSLSMTRKRPSLPFEKMITHAESYSSQEAEKSHIIDGVISSQEQMIPYLESKSVSLDGIETTLQIDNVAFKEYAPSWGQKILEVLANPNTAYFLFIIGVALIYFEFQAPGGFIAGSIGFCFLILSGIAFQILPLNWGALVLIACGFILLFLEMYVTSYGVLGLSGLAAVILGSLFLFHGDTGFISVQYSAMFSSLAGIGLGVGIVIWYLWKQEKKTKKVTDFFLPEGATGVVLNKLNENEYQIRVKGEIWNAFSDEKLEVNESVQVTDVDSDKLIIKIKKLIHT